MSDISKDTTLKELAALVSTALENANVEAVLVGGAAVSLYSDNVYQTYDLDFITRHSGEAISSALEPLGFTRKGKERHWENPNTEFLVEFPAGNLSFGETDMPIESAGTVSSSLGTIRVITPTQSVMDRMAAYIHWGDNQSREQAVMVIQNNPIDWEMFYSWAKSEKIDVSVIDSLRYK